jgi:hypothetical protein
MKKIKIFCNWGLDIDLYHEKQVELYVDAIPSNPVPENVVRFLFFLEPPEIAEKLYGNINKSVLGYLDRFDYIFTHNQEIIDKIPEKSILFPYGGCWIRDYDFKEKKFEVSTLVGGKKMAEGHLVRHDLWNRENEIKVPKKFFLSGNFGGIQNPNNNPVLGGDKSPLFDSQFHVCIENVKRENWFTEKLIDCLQTKTVPIYYGCPNIGDWFDVRGFIVVNDTKEIIESCNNLTSEVYNSMLPYIEYNFEKSKEYVYIAERLENKIKNIVGYDF